MNLVQINERLKDLPMRVLQQYANGMNPEVPPYLALGELQRREIAQKQMATAQGGMQGPQPSVKEQVEQKAGLMAAQALQQQQAMQQMQQPRGPMPVPAGVPQPEPQPEAMARGGLAGIPVRRDMFEYAGGGIIAFQSGGQPKYETRIDKLYRENRERAEKEEAERLEAIRAAGNETMPYGEQMRNVGRAIDRAVPDPVELLKTLVSAPGYGLSKGDAKVDRAPKVTQTGSPDIPSSPATGLPAALQKPPAAPARPPAPPAASAPRPAPAAAPAAPAPGLPAAAAQGNVTPYMKKLEDMIAKEPIAPTEQGVMESIGKMSPAAMQEKAMQKRAEDQRARAEQERAAYDKSRPSGLDDLIRVFGQAGQYKGLSGLAPAETALQQQRRAEDLAMEKRQNELLTAIEGREYEGAKELFGARTRAFDTAKQLFGREKESAIKAAGDLAQVDQTRINNELKIISEEKLKKLELASRAADRAQQGAGLALKTEYLAKMAKSRQLAEGGDAKGAAKLLAEANDILAVSGGVAASGVPKPMTRDQASDNVAKALENLSTAKTTIADAKAALASAGLANPTMAQIKEHLIQEQMKGVSLPAAGSSGKVPPPPPGFKPDKS